MRSSCKDCGVELVSKNHRKNHKKSCRKEIERVSGYFMTNLTKF